MLKNKSSNSFYPPGITKTEIAKRARYLNLRVGSLFENFLQWIKDLPQFQFKKFMEEVNDKEKRVRFKLPAAEVLHNDKKIADIKAAGLFAFGYNCRIDIQSPKGTAIIIDASKEKDDPDWQIFPIEAGKNPKKLNKIIFRNLLKKLIA